MAFNVPENLRYTESHEWIETNNDAYQVGISDFAQEELGDIVFVELPNLSETVEAGEPYGVVESIKAISDLYAPVSGTVTSTNKRLKETPELINDDPYGDGWIIELTDINRNDLESLLNPDDYRNQIE